MASDSISVRISEQQVQGIDYISKSVKRKKSETLREIVDLGIQQKRLELALEKFQRKEATAWRASRIAGIPLTSFLDILKDHKIVFHYSPEDLRKDFRGLV